MLTRSATIEPQRAASTAARSRSTLTTIALRFNLSASAPAYSPKSSHGSCWRSTASATSSGSCVSEATSSAGGEREMPSPMLLTHDDASGQRYDAPSRLGTMVSTIRLTSRKG